MDKGLVMFGIFILVLGILIPIIQSVNASRKESFENSENELEQLQDEIENFYQEKKNLKKAETEAKAESAKTEEKATKAVVKVVQAKQKAVAVESEGTGKVAPIAQKITEESITKCKKTLNQYAKQLAREAELANQKAANAKRFAESIAKLQ